jgi:hypothetical protein
MPPDERQGALVVEQARARLRSLVHATQGNN